MGHVRGAVVGDVLARMLGALGFDVAREYYTNDSGNQVAILAASTHLRYRELFGHSIEIPDGHYPGLYLIDVAQALKDRDGDKWLNAQDLGGIQDFAIEFMMNDIKTDLTTMNIDQIYSSEAKMIADGMVTECLKELDEKGLLYRGILETAQGQKAR